MCPARTVGWLARGRHSRPKKLPYSGVLLRCFGKIEQEIYQIWAPVGTRSPEPLKSFGHGPYFFCQLLSRNQVSRKIRVTPPPPPPPPPPLNVFGMTMTALKL